MTSLLEREAVEFTRDLIRIDSVNTGVAATIGDGETRAARYVQERLAEVGITSELIEPVPGRGSLIARIRGTDPTAPALLVHAHLDVVSVDEDDWTHPPFGGDIADGFVYGRGAVDMKNFAGTVLAVVRHFAREGFAPRRDLVLAFIALARQSKSPLVSSAAWLYIWFFRSVPLVVQLVVWYNLGYLYPTLGLGTPFTTDFWIVEFPTVHLISAFAAGVLGLSLHQAAYSAEIIRGGLLSVDQGQLEAAASLGIPPRRRLSRIVLPQAMRSIVPNATNEVIGLVKGTSVLFVIAIPELFYSVQVIYNRNSRVIPLLLVAVVWYTIITTILSIAQYYIERHYARGTVRVLPPTPVQRARTWISTQWARLGDESAPDARRQPPSRTAAATGTDTTGDAS
ncbi:M20/M25/M40 family metallo-hydrolase [Microbacterium sp.]|uniref:M20/M25/M40 family metallo-hydrolase n=1 Tax=Microbacterium sp. TaxID=51671 RepID=UPI0025EF0D73|nr:M20/M25/M40 family metallo-hydrolase [Microbacterium sp.]